MKVDQACRELGWTSFDRGHLAYHLWSAGAVKFGSFDLVDPKLSPSPIYFNFRVPPNGGPLSTSLVNSLGRELYLASRRAEIDFDLVAGIPRTGWPLADAFLRSLSHGSISYVRRSSDAGNLKGLLQKKSGKVCDFRPVVSDEAIGRKDRKVLLLDDVISGAGRKLEALTAVESAGYEAAGFVLVVDREQGGREVLEERGHQVASVWNISQLLDFYVLIEAITEEKRKEILGYIKRTKKPN